MTVNEIKSVKISTPKGVAVFPRLHEPDTKFKTEGEYSITLRLSEDDAADLMEKCSSMANAAFDAATEELNEAIKAATGKKKVDLKAVLDGLTLGLPYSPDYDDDGNANGFYLFKFKMVASGINKKTQKPWSRRPALFDSKGVPLKTPVEVWGGSEVRVAGELKPYFISGQKTAGCSLKLEAVKIIQLVSGGPKSASGYGFGEDEGGFDADDAQAMSKPDSVCEGEHEEGYDGGADEF